MLCIDQIVKRHFFYSIDVYCNKYSALSIPLSGDLFWALWILIIAIIVVFLWKVFFDKHINYWDFFALTLVLSGAFSNVLDRWREGCVIDYMDFFGLFVYNLADIMIVLGIIIIGGRRLLQSSEKQE